MRRALGLAALALLAGCGMRTALEPPPGESLPPAAAVAPRAATPDELLTPPPVARPDRIDELLRRSEERVDDRFDLPPPGTTSRTVPVPRDRSAGRGSEQDPDRPETEAGPD